jgi:hypothetical protein
VDPLDLTLVSQATGIIVMLGGGASRAMTLSHLKTPECYYICDIKGGGGQVLAS